MAVPLGADSSMRINSPPVCSAVAIHVTSIPKNQCASLSCEPSAYGVGLRSIKHILLPAAFPWEHLPQRYDAIRRALRHLMWSGVSLFTELPRACILENLYSYTRIPYGTGA